MASPVNTGPVSIGDMRHPVTIQEKSRVQDPTTGEITNEWADLATVWASIDSVSGSEFIAASAEQAKTTHRIGMYYRDDLTPKTRLKSAGITYEIKALLPNNDRSQLVVMCEVLS